MKIAEAKRRAASRRMPPFAGYVDRAHPVPSAGISIMGLVLRTVFAFSGRKFELNESLNVLLKRILERWSDDQIVHVSVTRIEPYENRSVIGWGQPHVWGVGVKEGPNERFAIRHEWRNNRLNSLARFAIAGHA